MSVVTVTYVAASSSLVKTRAGKPDQAPGTTLRQKVKDLAAKHNATITAIDANNDSITCPSIGHQASVMEDDELNTLPGVTLATTAVTQVTVSYTAAQSSLVKPRAGKPDAPPNTTLRQRVKDLAAKHNRSVVPVDGSTDVIPCTSLGMVASIMEDDELNTLPGITLAAA